MPTRFAPDHIDLDIESLSLEICSVLITRSWFAPEVFKAGSGNSTTPVKFSRTDKSLSLATVPPMR